jgi:hypothetical protein
LLSNDCFGQEAASLLALRSPEQKDDFPHRSFAEFALFYFITLVVHTEQFNYDWRESVLVWPRLLERDSILCARISFALLHVKQKEARFKQTQSNSHMRARRRINIYYAQSHPVMNTMRRLFCIPNVDHYTSFSAR